MSLSAFSALMKQRPANCDYRLAVIDGKNLFYRSFYGHSKGSMGDFPGVFGTLSFLCEVLKAFGKECLVAVCWDYGLDPERVALFPGYKNRPRNKDIDYEQMNDDLIASMRLSKMLPVFTAYPLQGVAEGDDLIASVVSDFRRDEPGRHGCILSDDTDFIQLVTNTCHVYAPRKKILYTPVTVPLYAECLPERYLFMKAMIGDATDTIPGVPGIGKVAGPKLVEHYASIEDMQSDPTKCTALRMAGKVAKVLQHSDVLRRNLQLISLKKVPYDFEWTPNYNRLNTEVKDLGYVSLRQNLRDVFSEEACQ